MKLLTSLVTAALVLFVSGCNDSSDTKADKPVSTPMTQEQASSALNIINSLGFSGLTSTLANPLSDLSGAKSQQITASAPDTELPYISTKPCPISGSVDIEGSASTTTFSVFNQYHDCETLPGFVVNGTNLSSGGFKNYILDVNTTANNFTVTKGDTDFVLTSDIKMLFDYNAKKAKITLNGENSLIENYEGFQAQYDINFYDLNVTQNWVDNTMSIDGEISIFFESCIDNYIYIQTEEPLVPQDGIFTSGTLLINDAVYEFLDDGSVNVDVYGYNFNTIQGVEAICPFEFYYEFY